MADWISLLAQGTKPDEVGGAFQAGYDDARKRQVQDQDIAIKRQALAQQQAYRSRVAQVLQSGDLRTAAAMAFANGDDKNGTGFTNLQKNSYEQGAKGAGALGEVVRGIASLPYDQRHSAIQAAKPALINMGMASHEIDAFDPTDQNLASVGGIGYSAHERQSDVQGQFDGETKRIDATNPKVVGQSLVTTGGQELFRAPQYVNAPTTNNVYEVPGTTSQGWSGGPITAEQLYNTAIKPQESGGLPNGGAGAVGPATRYGRAVGASQMLPATAQSMAQKLGIDWRPDLMRARTPEGLAYQDKLGIAYADTALKATGGDPRKAAMFYHGGPDQSIWGPKTNAYGDSAVGRLDKVYGKQDLTRAPKIIQQGSAVNTGTGGLDPNDPQMSLIQAIAEGRAPAPNSRTKDGAALLGKVTQYDPTFDAANATSRQKTRVDYTSGKMAQSRTAINTAIGHMITLDETGKSLNNFQTAPGILNPLYNAGRSALGNTDLPKFEQTKQAVASEMRKVFTNTGGTLQELEEWQHNLSSSSSYAQLHSVIQNGAELLTSRLHALQTQYTTGMGRSDQMPEFVTPANAMRMKARFGVDLGGTSGGAQAPSNNAAQSSGGVRIKSSDAQMLLAGRGTDAQFDAHYGAGAAAKLRAKYR